MYAYLQGKFTLKTPTQVYIDVQGVGYEVLISLHTYSQIQSLQDGRLYIHLQVKEDSHNLFGFFEPAEKEMFLQLVSVSGVGASTARMMLSHLKPAEISAAILAGNVRQLESIKGIGKKTAERLVLELKDKMGKATAGAVAPLPAGNTLQQDALNALTALGIGRPVAETAIKKVLQTETDINNLELLIKKALRTI
jgi:Holliday junction DNA helicase RuvA